MPARASLFALVTLIGAAASAQTPVTLASYTPISHTPADTVRPAAAPLDARDARAAALLDAWVVGDLSPLVDATASARRADAWRDFAAARRAMTSAHGDAVSAHVLGTASTADGGRITRARIQFADGTETVALHWSADGALATLVRAGRATR